MKPYLNQKTQNSDKKIVESKTCLAPNSQSLVSKMTEMKNPLESKSQTLIEKTSADPKNQAPTQLPILKTSPELPDFYKMKNAEIHLNLQKLTRSERKLTHLILLHIQQIEARRIHLELGHSSMFEYLTRTLGYSESCAYRRLQSARLLKQLPEIQHAIENGSLKLTQLSQVQTAIRTRQKNLQRATGQSRISLQEEARVVVEKLQNKTQKQTELILAQEFDLPLQTQEFENLQKDESLRLELTFTKEETAELQKLKNLLSHQIPGLKWKDLFLTLAQKELQKLGLNRSPTEAPARKNLRPFLIQSANHQCEYIHPKTQKRCECRSFLQVDHRVPRVFGGSNDKENLRVLCQTHNLAEARRWGLHWRSAPG